MEEQGDMDFDAVSVAIKTVHAISGRLGIACLRTMHSMFSGRVISRFGDIPLLPRSPDLKNCFSYGLPEIADILSQALTSRKRKEGIKDKKWLQWMARLRPV